MYSYRLDASIDLHVKEHISESDALRQMATAEEVLKKLEKYPGQILADEEVELFSKYIENSDKAVYDLIPCDSGPERDFVKALEARDDVQIYAKLPGWFTIPTPVGEYNPDWAVVIEDEDGKTTLYMVAETKSTLNLDELHPDEKRKIYCGAAHFGSTQYTRDGALDGVDYKVVTSADELP